VGYTSRVGARNRGRLYHESTPIIILRVVMERCGRVWKGGWREVQVWMGISHLQ
jgi:hypothetical protein